jgi:hypothetical protein
MTTSAKRKCLHCREFFRPDHRNVHHQHYCSKSDCRRQSKVENQRRWLQKPENQNYFRDPDNSQRVKENSDRPSPRCSDLRYVTPYLVPLALSAGNGPKKPTIFNIRVPSAVNSTKSKPSLSVP